MKKSDIIFESLSSFTILTFLNWVLLSVQVSFNYGNFIIFSLSFITMIFLMQQIIKTSKRIFNKSWSRLLFFVVIIVTVILIGYFFGYLNMEIVKFE